MGLGLVSVRAGLGALTVTLTADQQARLDAASKLRQAISPR
jgi:hypothetical protein